MQCIYTRMQPLGATKIEDTKKICVWSCGFKILRVIFSSYSSEYKNRPKKRNFLSRRKSGETLVLVGKLAS